MRSWERVEAKLDRLSEEQAGMARVLRAVADRTLEFTHRFDRIDRRLDRIEGRLDRIEGQEDDLRRMVEDLDRRILALEGEEQ
ncbi:MAG TPA: hypothetical protein VFG43_08230 [Geminicoccaceae bacterium]|nr:hypothetical protein [Geminicoccaceae bacterium]